MESLESNGKRGIAHKYARSGPFRNWKKRFFVLEGERLTYYTESDMHERKGHVNLFGATVERNTDVPNKPYCIEISNCQGDDDRDLLMNCVSEADMYDWMRRLRTATRNEDYTYSPTQPAPPVYPPPSTITSTSGSSGSSGGQKPPQKPLPPPPPTPPPPPSDLPPPPPLQPVLAPAKELYARGLQLEENEQYTEAVDSFSQLLQQLPNHAKGLVHRGYCYTKLQKLHEAQHDFQAAERLESDHEVFICRGRGYAETYQFDLALMDYKHAEDRAPHLHLYRDKALCYMGMEKYDDCISLLRQGLEQDQSLEVEKRADYYADIAKALMYLRRYDEAVQACEQALECAPRHSRAQLIKSCSLIYGHRDDVMLVETNRCIVDQANSEQPQDCDVLQLCAEIKYALEEFGSAHQLANQILKRNPNYADAYLLLARVLEETNDFNEALDRVDSSLKIRPKSPSGLLYRGLLLFKLGRLQEAAQGFKASLQLKPSATAYHHYALCASEMKNFQLALSLLSSAIEMEPENPDHYLKRSLLYQQTNNVEAALSDLDQVLILKPNDRFTLDLRESLHNQPHNSS